ncbi:MAG: hypothetical protein JW757_00660 [Anaerolineales bacterium]|nr:hypothetical protein [Anaerolineales bacterium]
MQLNQYLSFFPSGLQDNLDSALQNIEKNQVLPRLWRHDHTLWAPSPDQISNRLDWLELPSIMSAELDSLTNFAQELPGLGFSSMVLLGMGGSSLAPEVFKKVFGPQPGFLDLLVIDTTDPVAIRKVSDSLDLTKSLFIVATKSGGTVETLSLFKYFYHLLDADPAISKVGSHFIAITDPGSKLEQLAAEFNFRKIFLNNPNLGGRYSALSHFGLVPAASLGLDLSKILKEATSASGQNSPLTPPAQSPAAQLGALIAAGFIAGRDKLTFISNPEIASFSDWIEQLIAESTGKSGKGILPVVGEPIPSDLSLYGDDRIFVLQQLGHSATISTLAVRLKQAGFPVIESQIQDPHQLGNLILTWQIATAIAGHLIGIQPFDQPDVESAKIAARQSVQTYHETGMLPECVVEKASAKKIDQFLIGVENSDYIALQAYLPPFPEIEAVFRQIQAKLRDKHKLAVTFGFGPRFLHSTGQLHKGDRGNGYFIQFITPPPSDLAIPDQAGRPESKITFGTLKQAQALGDGAALEAQGRKLLVINLDDPVLNSLTELKESL